MLSSRYTTARPLQNGERGLTPHHLVSVWTQRYALNEGESVIAEGDIKWTTAMWATTEQGGKAAEKAMWRWQAAWAMQTCDLAIFIHALPEIFNIFRYFKEMEQHEF